MSLTLQPVCVGNGSDEEGLLVFDNEQQLVAVLSHLSEDNEAAPGQWYLEAGFGRIDGTSHPTFSDLDLAQAWINKRLARRSRDGLAVP